MPTRLPAEEKKSEHDGAGSKWHDLAFETQDSAEECWSTATGSRMCFLRAGEQSSRPPLLLIHGLVAYSFSWRFNIAALSRSRVVYAVDLPGLGHSERVNGIDSSLKATASRLCEFLREQNVREFDILGTSHGGAVAMMLAGLSLSDSQMPRIRRMVLSAPVNPWSRHGRWITRVLATRPGSELFRVAEPLLGTTHRFFLRRMYGDVSRIKPGTLEGYSAPLKVPGTTEHLLSIVRSWHKGLRDIKAVLPNIAGVPTLLIWGGRDRAVFPQSAEPLKAQFHNAELVIIPDAGHLPYEEVPEEFNRIVLDFLDRAERQG